VFKLNDTVCHEINPNLLGKVVKITAWVSDACHVHWENGDTNICCNSTLVLAKSKMRIEGNELILEEHQREG